MGAYYAHYYSDGELVQRRADHAGRRGGGADVTERLRAWDTLRRLSRLSLTADPGTRLLDVGCGVGGFLRAVRDQCGAQVCGVDTNERCRAFAAEVYGIDVDVGELSEQGYADASFDVVTAWHVLEHVWDPAAELAELARITRPGGLLVLEVPCPSWIGRLFRGRWVFLQAPTHLHHFAPGALCGLLEAAGFEPVQVVRPWLPGELAGSLILALGVHGFAPRLMIPPHTGRDRAWRWLLALFMVLDLPLTLLQAVLRRAGIVRVIARRRDGGSGR